MAERSESKAFVCGHPIAHSRSPMIHGHWLKTYGIDGSYRAIDIAPADFADFMANLPAIRLRRRQCHHSAQGGGFRLRRRSRRSRRTDRRRQHALARRRQDLAAATPMSTALPPISTSTRRPGGSPRGAVVVGAGGAARAVCWRCSRPASATSASPTARSSAPGTEAIVSAAIFRRIGLDALPEILGGRRSAGQHHLARHAWRQRTAGRSRRCCPRMPSSPTSSMSR